MWLWLIHMKPLLRSTDLMGESPTAAGALVSEFWLTGIHCSTISRSLHNHGFRCNQEGTAPVLRMQLMLSKPGPLLPLTVQAGVMR